MHLLSSLLLLLVIPSCSRKMSKSVSNTDSSYLSKSETEFKSDSSKAFIDSKYFIDTEEGKFVVDLWYDSNVTKAHILPYYFGSNSIVQDKILLPYIVSIGEDSGEVVVKSNQPIKKIQGQKKKSSEMNSSGSAFFSSSITEGKNKSDSGRLKKEVKPKSSETNSRSFNWSFSLMFVGIVLVFSFFIYLLLKRKR